MEVTTRRREAVQHVVKQKERKTIGARVGVRIDLR